MLIGSFNIYGLRSIIKKSKVKEFVSSNYLEFMVTQETNLCDMSTSLVYFLWGNLFLRLEFFPRDWK